MTNISDVYLVKHSVIVRVSTDLISYYLNKTHLSAGEYLYNWNQVASSSPYLKAETEAIITLLQYNALRVIEHQNDPFRYDRAIINLGRYYKECVDRWRPQRHPSVPVHKPKLKPKPNTTPKQESYRPHEIYRTIGISRNRWLYVRKKVNLPNRKKYSQQEYDKVQAWNTQHPPGTPHRK